MAEIAFPQSDVQNYHRTDADEEQNAGTAEKKDESSFLRERSRVLLVADGPGQCHPSPALARSSVDYHYAQIEARQ